MDTKCAYIGNKGKLCKAKPIKSGKFCFWHTPGFKKTRLEASKNGGLNRRLQGAYGDAVILRTPFDTYGFLGDVINAVWTGKVPVQVGTSMGFLTRCWLDAYEASETETRIKEIETRLEEAGV